MAKKRYRFNPDTLNYERIGISIKERFKKILAYFSSSLALSLIFAVVAIYFYESPKTKAYVKHPKAHIDTHTHTNHTNTSSL